MRAERGWLKGLNPTVAMASKAVVLLLVVYGAVEAAKLVPSPAAGSVFQLISNSILGALGWWYIILVAATVVFAFWLAISRVGRIRLGRDDERPEFGLMSWFAMLFAAGMGIGLVFYGVAEPVFHFQDNPFQIPGDQVSAERTAMRLTFFHWGLHPWAIYGVMAAGLGYFSFRKGLPLTVRSALYPLIGDRIYGPIGHVADILAVFATTVGVATSLGLGVQQVNAGLNHLMGVEISLGVQLILIALITTAAVISVATGLEKGIKFISQLNVWLAAALLAFVASVGPTASLISEFIQNTGDYLQNLIFLSFWTDAYQRTGWQASWTTFYWGWWISWSPFVGMFVARISRGRTVREMILGVTIVPTLVTFLWMTVMGGAALDQITSGDPTDIVGTVNTDVSLSLYALLEALSPGLMGTIVAGLAAVLVVLFFVTSSDSGTLVTNTILSVGDLNPPVAHRVIWGVSEGAVAAVLLAAGGLSALQAAAISAALPFTVVMVAMSVGLAISMVREEKAMPAHERPHGKPPPRVAPSPPPRPPERADTPHGG